MSSKDDCVVLIHRFTVTSFHAIPLPGALVGVAYPFSNGKGSCRKGLVRSSHSSPCAAVGVTAMRWALTSGKR